MTPNRASPNVALAVFTCFWVAVALQAQIVVNVGTHSLLPNTPNQSIPIHVSGGAAVAGLNFRAQVADGFPDVPGSLVDGPNITGVDIIGTTSPTIFTGNNTGQQDPGSVPQLSIRTTTTSSGTVTANGLLVTLTLDTTGFATGTYALSLSSTFAGGTSFLDSLANPISSTITDGSLMISAVPEPVQSVTVIGFCLALLGGYKATVGRRCGDWG